MIFDRIDDDKPDEKSVEATEELINQMTAKFKPVQRANMKPRWKRFLSRSRPAKRYRKSRSRK